MDWGEDSDCKNLRLVVVQAGAGWIGEREIEHRAPLDLTSSSASVRRLRVSFQLVRLENILNSVDQWSVASGQS